jgi:hypothetical protein
MKYSNDTIRNQTHDLLAHSAVPQPIAPLHTPDGISRVAVKETTAEQVIPVHRLSIVLNQGSTTSGVLLYITNFKFYVQRIKYKT